MVDFFEDSQFNVMFIQLSLLGVLLNLNHPFLGRCRCASKNIEVYLESENPVDSYKTHIPSTKAIFYHF